MELRFRIAGIPVRVEPGFWLVSALLGWGGGSIRNVVIWIACVFVGVLCHELGHALAGRAFGGRPEIILYSMGGLTSTSAAAPLGRVRSIGMSLAGPVAGFLLGGAVLLLSAVLLPGDGNVFQRLLTARADAQVMHTAIRNLLWINLGWGLVNLIPVLPFDGGHVAQQILGEGEKGWHRAAWLSVVVGPAMAIISFVMGWTWAGLLFALSAVQTIRELLARRSRRADQDSGLVDAMNAANDALESEDLRRALREGGFVLEKARSPELKRNAAHVVAIALLRLGEPERALETLLKLPPGQADTLTMGVCLLQSGKPHEAARHFEVAWEQGAEGAEELLIRALEESGDSKRADEIRAQRDAQNSSNNGNRAV